MKNEKNIELISALKKLFLFNDNIIIYHHENEENSFFYINDGHGNIKIKNSLLDKLYNKVSAKNKLIDRLPLKIRMKNHLLILEYSQYLNHSTFSFKRDDLLKIIIDTEKEKINKELFINDKKELIKKRI